MMLFERWQYIKLLYETLPDRQNHAVTGKTLESLSRISDAEVSVRFTDGSEDQGSIVVGADGVYSKVRECIIQHAPKHVFTYDPYWISFRALYGVGPLPTGMDTGVVREIPHQGWWFQIISQPQRVFWMLYQALDRPVERPTFYGEQEAEALAKEHEDFPVGEGFIFKQLRASKTFEKLAVLEEGVATRWYWKRVVLIGDAVHKVVTNDASPEMPIHKTTDVEVDTESSPRRQYRTRIGRISRQSSAVSVKPQLRSHRNGARADFWRISARSSTCGDGLPQTDLVSSTCVGRCRADSVAKISVTMSLSKIGCAVDS